MKRSSSLIGLLLLLFAIALSLSLLSFKQGQPHNNFLGLLGYGLSWLVRNTFGLSSLLLVAGAFGLSFRLLNGKRLEKRPIVFFAILLVSTSFLLNIFADAFALLTVWTVPWVPFEAGKNARVYLGGLPTFWLFKDLPYINLKHLLSSVGCTLLFSGAALASILELTEWRLWHLALDKIQSMRSGTRLKNLLSLFQRQALKPILEQVVTPAAPKTILPIKERTTLLPAKKELNLRREPPPKPKAPTRVGNYQLPPSTLLTEGKKVDLSQVRKELEQHAQVLEETLLSFGIEAKVGQVSCGPTIVSFEVQPAIGVKVQKIKALENDIALNLQAKSLRILAPIPGKACVGVEIPSPRPQEVNFREMMEAYQRSGKRFEIPVVLGKTVSGEEVMTDLTRMPHLIIAGATGSGKSVCINSIIMSILMNASPDQIRLIMVDPKKVELTAYSKLPHMIAPVITEPKGAAAALNWLVREMERRYELLKTHGVRNIIGYNESSRRENDAPAHLPYIVTIVDELADLMAVSQNDIETPITRIAQMARAVGIHLILATQRPSREVITGLIKANFPTRIAFKVSSRVNSQIILDEIGAESLLGNGDMLFLPPGTSVLTRAQGAFVRDEDIHRTIDFISDQAGPDYLIRSFDNLAAEEASSLLATSEDDFNDDLYDQALDIVQSTGQASTTFLQRKLKIGYARAASLMDILEQRGIISPQEGAKPRKVLNFKSESIQEEF